MPSPWHHIMPPKHCHEQSLTTEPIVTPKAPQTNKINCKRFQNQAANSWHIERCSKELHRVKDSAEAKGSGGNDVCHWEGVREGRAGGASLVWSKWLSG